MTDVGKKTKQQSGGCLCGAVRYKVSGTLRQVIMCHCSQCLRFHGHHAAYTATAIEDLVIEDEKTLKWFGSSSMARRGFCSTCGSSLFWHKHDRPYIAISAGTLDQPTDLETQAHIFTDNLADYYTLTDTLKKYPQGLPKNNFNK